MSSSRRSRMETNASPTSKYMDEDIVLDLKLPRKARRPGTLSIEIPNGRKLTTSPVSTPPREMFKGESLSMSPAAMGFRKRVDSISLLKNMHGCNTMPDDEVDSPLHSHSYSSSPEQSNHLGDRKIKRVDSVTLLRRLNNLNTSDYEGSEAMEASSPRSSKIKTANEAFLKKAGESGRKKKSNLWLDSNRGDLETTTYFDSVQNKAPMLERRDSITLQHTMQGMNTIYGVHSESPRWKKVAAINRKRVAKKLKDRKSEIEKAASPAKIGLNIDSDEDDDAGGGGEEEQWANPRGEGGSRGKMDSISLHQKMGGFNTAESEGVRLRNRVDSVQLQMSRGGNNTMDTFMVPREEEKGGEGEEGKEAKEEEEEKVEEKEKKSKFFGRKGKDLKGSRSPRLVRVRELNAKYKDKDDVNVGRGGGGGGGKRGTRKSAPSRTTFVFGDNDNKR
ncbi:hypothetical protein TrST_g3321 [Triparma strigata]|uniref:Uncharacterized protein n=1 Tax=Triparma strigata TaxID=1606541 RepID=A0A9W7ECJ9_9STRA|nr:hypothetical protein TrST_g3321 [Triparma strigata]